ncbi:MAG: DeoR/GlpR family DNA-binding transcription regulator [Rubricella sp.]
MSLSLRQTEILSLAQARGAVTVEDLASRFGVTAQTIRRDLGELCETRHLARVHGGAVLPTGSANIAYGARRALAAEAKERIARHVARLIPDNASVLLNIGTTTEAIARELVSRRGLLVLTNNLNIATILSNAEGVEVIVAGGRLRKADGGLIGDDTAAMIRRFRVDMAVIGASALDEDGTILDYDMDEVRVSRAILENARAITLAVDHTKFGRSAPVRIGNVSEIDRIVTDAPPPSRFAEHCAATETLVEIA